MFLNYIKEFFVKKSLKNHLYNVQNKVFTNNVQTIGLVVDESKFTHSEELLGEIISKGIVPQNVKIAAYRSKFDAKITYSRPTFGK